MVQIALEIERKFLLNRFPQEEIDQGQWTLVSIKRIDQTYLAIDNNDEFRVRKIVEQHAVNHYESYTHTFKRGTGLVREEVELQISREIYEQLLSSSNRLPLEKVRTTIQSNKVMAEIDQYIQFPFRTVEVEFECDAAAAQFIVPPWFGREVGADQSFRNKTLWYSLQKS